MHQGHKTTHTFLGDSKVGGGKYLRVESNNHLMQLSPSLKSRQVKALTFKILSSQKRAWKTNLCCVFACPVLIVVFSGLITAFLISHLSVIDPIEILYCSNMDASNSTFGYPILSIDQLPTTSKTGYPGATLEKIHHANFLSIGPIYYANIASKTPCVYEFGGSYPTSNSSLYQPTPNLPMNPLTHTKLSEMVLRDSSFMPQIKTGWLPLFLQPSMDFYNVSSYFLTNQIRYDFQYGYSSLVSASDLGSPPAPVTYSLADFAELPVIPAFANASDGILGSIPVRYWYDLYKSLNSVPLYSYLKGDVNVLDDSIAEMMRSSRKNNFNHTNSSSYYYVFFNLIDHAKLAYNFLYSPGGIQQIYQQTQLDNSVLRCSNSSYFSAQITQGFRAMPELKKTQPLNLPPFDSTFGFLLYPFGISFLLPVFVVVLVREKEERIAIMMKMNGLKTSVYYFSHYVTFLIQYLLSVTAFSVTGYMMKLTFFTQTSSVFLLIILLIWGNVQISLAFFLSSFIKKSRIANIFTIILVICSLMISMALNIMESISYRYFIWPPFAFYRILAMINQASSGNKDVPPLGLRDLNLSNNVGVALLFLFIEIFVYLLMSIYITSVAPKEFGIRKPWHFPITDLIKYLSQSKSRSRVVSHKNTEKQVLITMDESDSELKYEDADVKEERARIVAGNYDPNCPLVMKHMRKVYAGRGGLGPKLAVKDVTLAVEEGVIFGLLGPNGAGKTTLINILTGLYEATEGEATIAGFDICKESNKAYCCMGICPQFDIHWGDLTVEEHLYFYTRLKGIPNDQEQVAVTKALERVSLQKLRKRLAVDLSGGEKRRLSIAIALCGNLSVLFLDEPTTGLDPEVRRLIWNIINDARESKTIVLTTHSMEEAEALCQRIGIMAKGTLRCLANPIRLKEIYGSGFKLFFNSLEQDTPRASEFIQSLLPNGWTKVDSFATNVSYEFPAVDGVISRLFQLIEYGKVEHGILDWGLGQTTLEEVFVKLVNDSDAQADY